MKNNIGFWTDPRAWVEWRCTAKEPGVYEVTIPLPDGSSTTITQKYKAQYYKSGETRVDAWQIKVAPNQTVSNVDFALVQNDTTRASVPEEDLSLSLPEPRGAAEERSSEGLGFIQGKVTDAAYGVGINEATVYALEIDRWPSFTAGEPMGLVYELVPATKTVILEGGAATAEVQIMPDAVGAYVVFSNAANQHFFANAFSGVKAKFFRYPVAFAYNAKITQLKGIIDSYWIDSSIPSGTYQVKAVMVPPGAYVGDSNNWISNVPVIVFDIKVANR